jgi:pimeloyl-ACP methyl ester carboxylesterase
MTGRSSARKLVSVALVLVAAVMTARADSNPWIRHESSDRGVIVFVHGLLGDERSTWTSGNFYWPEMLTHDRAFDGQDIYMYHYPSPRLGQAFTIDELADNMRLVLTADGVLQHSEITFVAHSMGGIVTRAYIIRYRQVVPKIRFLFFFATPTTGSSYARLGGLVSHNPQFKELYPMSADSYLAPLQSDWEAAGLKLKSYCAFETQPLYGQIIVDRQSATNLCTEHFDPIDADHYNIVKPKDEKSTSYLALKAAFVETAPSSDLPQATRSSHSVPKEPTPSTGVVYLKSWGMYDTAGVTTTIIPPNPPVLTGNTMSKVVAYGNLLDKYKGRYKIAAACFFWNGLQDVNDTKGISKSAAFDITDGDIAMAIPWNEEFLRKFKLGARQTTYLLLLLPTGLEPSQFDSARGAMNKGAVVLESHGGPP